MEIDRRVGNYKLTEYSVHKFDSNFRGDTILRSVKLIFLMFGFTFKVKIDSRFVKLSMTGCFRT